MQQQRPDIARLMQLQASQLPPAGPPGLPPGLLSGHPGAPGLPTSLALLAGLPASLTQAGPALPHPAFASLLAQQKPGAAAAAAAAAAIAHEMALARPKEDEDRKRTETNGGERTFREHNILWFHPRLV